MYIIINQINKVALVEKDSFWYVHYYKSNKQGSARWKRLVPSSAEFQWSYSSIILESWMQLFNYRLLHKVDVYRTSTHYDSFYLAKAHSIVIDQ